MSDIPVSIDAIKQKVDKGDIDTGHKEDEMEWDNSIFLIFSCPRNKNIKS